MKKLITGALLACGWMALAQTHNQDSIEFDQIHVEEVVVIDQWLHKHRMSQTATGHQLELQLKQLQGVNLISRGSFAQETVYRGQSEGRLQVKLNGMRIYSACTDRMDPSTSYVAANNLKTAKVASGCESSCTSSGLAGNLDLELKGASFVNSREWRWGYSQQYHSNTNGLVSNMSLEKQLGKLAFRINGSWQQHGNYAAGGGEEVQYSQNQKQNWALNTAYRLSDKELLRLDVIYDRATGVGYPSLPMDVGLARAVIAGATYTSHKGLGPFAHYELKLYHNDIYHEMDDSQRQDVFMRMDMPGWSQTTGATLNTFDWKLGKHNLSAAAEYYTNFRRAEMAMYPPEGTGPSMFMLTWPDARIHGLGAGITDHWHFGKSHLSTTLRADFETSGIMDELGGRQWEGMGYEVAHNRRFVLPQVKMAFSHQLQPKHKLKSSVGYGERGPTTSELFGFYLFNAHDAFDYLGKPGLRTEKLLSAEAGHEWNSKKFSLSTTLFLQHYRDYIFGLNSTYDAMTWGARGVRIYENIPEANFYGVEMKARYAAPHKFSAFAQAEYLRGLRGRGVNLPLIPPLQGSLGLNYQHKAFTFLAQSRMAMEQQHYSAEYGDLYTPGYALLDASVGYGWKWEKMHLNLSVAANNLLDTRYRDHLNWAGIPGMGRNIILKLQIAM